MVWGKAVDATIIMRVTAPVAVPTIGLWVFVKNSTKNSHAGAISASSLVVLAALGEATLIGKSWTSTPLSPTSLRLPAKRPA